MKVLRSTLTSVSVAAVVTTLCVSNTALGAEEAEVALANADAYTVVVKTTVRYPFGDDSVGRSQGAGFVVDRARGWILTNAHVASRSVASITVRFRSGEPIEAKRIYVDPAIDLAMLEVPPASLPQTAGEATLDCGELPRAGIPVVAYGHPGGLQFTGTKGIISGVSWKYDSELLQTDAAINPGNSGGPLINLSSGRITGINTASIARLQNTSFALASRFACPIVELLRADQDPSPPKTDWRFFSYDEDVSTIKIAFPGVFGDRLGIKTGDIIVSVNGSAPPSNETQILHAMRGKLNQLNIVVERSGKKVSLHGQAQPESRLLDRRGLFASGMLLSDFEERVRLELPFKGVVVDDVEKGSAAENAEIQAASILVSVNGMETSNLNEVQKALTAASSTNAPAVLVFKKFSSKSNAKSLFDWQERRVVVANVKMMRVGDPVSN